jgi:hypothetical protein
LLGESLRTPFSISGTIKHLHDEASEMRRAVWRMNLAENIVSDKKLKLFQESQEKAQERFEQKDFSKGNQVFVRLHRMPKGESKKTWLSWDGPYEVTDVKELTIQINKKGIPTMVNKTTVIALRHEAIPPRNLRGQAQELDEEEHKDQEKRFKEKLTQVKKHLKNSTEASDDDEEEDPEQEAMDIKNMEKLLIKLAKKRPIQKRLYKIDELKKDDIVIAFAMKKVRLCKVLYIRLEDKDPNEWIRLHMYGKDPNNENKIQIWKPWWLGAKSKAFLQSHPHPYSKRVLGGYLCQ